MAFMNQQIKKQLAPAIKDVLKKYGVKGSISVSNHSTLCVTLTSGDINLCEGKARDYFQVNEYQLDNHYDGVVRDFLSTSLIAGASCFLICWFTKAIIYILFPIC